jgi:predicted DNA-binding WGR domain protein
MALEPPSAENLAKLGDVRYFSQYVEKILLEYREPEENHLKYYHLSRKKDETQFLAQWGRIGAAPQNKLYDKPIKTFKDLPGVNMWTQMRSKMDKGYKIIAYKKFDDHTEGYYEFMNWLEERDVKLLGEEWADLI